MELKPRSNTDTCWGIFFPHTQPIFSLPSQTFLKALAFLILSAVTGISSTNDFTIQVVKGSPVTSLGASLTGIAVSGSHAFIASSRGLIVMNVTNAALPVEVASYGGPISTLTLAGAYAYTLSTAGAGMEVVDVADPTNCVHVGGYPESGRCITVANGYAYIGGDNFLRIVDITDPSYCVLSNNLALTVSVRGAAVAGSYAYLACGPGGLKIFDVSDPANCHQVGECLTNLSSYGVTVANNYAYFTSLGGGAMYIVDVSTPSNPVPVGSYSTGAICFDVTVYGRFACLAAGVSGLHVIDISNPTNCVRVAGFKISPARPLCYDGRRVCVAGASGDFAVLASVPNLQITLQVSGATEGNCVLEASATLSSLSAWNPVFTNDAVTPFFYVDNEVYGQENSPRFYRARCPQ